MTAEQIATMPQALAQALQRREPILVLSPHLDDAVLSCGALLEYATRRCTVVVATVFTEVHDRRPTRAGRKFLAQCDSDDAPALFADRREEDVSVLQRLGAKPVHMGQPDALFRRRKIDNHLAYYAGEVLPELVHCYPTYRFDIALGRVSRADRKMRERLGVDIDALVESLSPSAILCPIGVGRHVDHLITRDLGLAHPDTAVFYGDFPYLLSSSADPDFVSAHGLQSWSWDVYDSNKTELIEGYRSQVDALFPDHHIPIRPEVYYADGGGTPSTGRYVDDPTV